VDGISSSVRAASSSGTGTSGTSGGNSPAVSSVGSSGAGSGAGVGAGGFGVAIFLFSKSYVNDLEVIGSIYLSPSMLASLQIKALWLSSPTVTAMTRFWAQTL